MRLVTPSHHLRRSLLSAEPLVQRREARAWREGDVAREGFQAAERPAAPPRQSRRQLLEGMRCACAHTTRVALLLTATSRDVRRHRDIGQLVSGISDNKILAQLPNTMRSEILRDIHADTLHFSSLLSKISAECCIKLLEKFQTELILEKEVASALHRRAPSVSLIVEGTWCLAGVNRQWPEPRPRVHAAPWCAHGACTRSGG